MRPHSGSSRPREEPGIGRVVLDDLKRTDIPRWFRRDLRDLHRFYLSEERREQLASMGTIKAIFWFSVWLAKSLLMKLSPARRLLLLLAVLLMIWGGGGLSAGGLRIDFPFDLAGVLLVFLVLMLELKDKLLVRDEIEAARQVQLALLPRRHPEVDGWAIWSHTRPANDVGGDLVDYLPLEGGRVGVALGDVAGKGLGAALLMAKLQTTLHAIVSDCTSMEDLGRRLNAVLLRDGLENRYSTLFYFEISPGSGRMRYLNAGHNPPLVLRPGTCEELPASSLPIGMMTGTLFAEDTSEIQPGEMLIVYSDGLTEARNERDEEFGLERLTRLLPDLRGREPREAGERLLREVERFQGDARLHDDLSLVVAARL